MTVLLGCMSLSYMRSIKDLNSISGTSRVRGFRVGSRRNDIWRALLAVHKGTENSSPAVLSTALTLFPHFKSRLSKKERKKEKSTLSPSCWAIVEVFVAVVTSLSFIRVVLVVLPFRAKRSISVSQTTPVGTQWAMRLPLAPSLAAGMLLRHPFAFPGPSLSPLSQPVSLAMIQPPFCNFSGVPAWEACGGRVASK